MTTDPKATPAHPSPPSGPTATGIRGGTSPADRMGGSRADGAPERRPRGRELPLALAALAFGLGVVGASWPDLADAHPAFAAPAAGAADDEGDEGREWRLPPGHPPIDCELPAGHAAVGGHEALPPGHPPVAGHPGLPPGHPPVGATRELPPGHPPVAGSPRRLPAGHPPVDAWPPPALLFPQERTVTL